MTTKHITTHIKTPDSNSGDPEGTFTGYASVFGNVDSYGDVVVKGAFAESLEKQSTYPVYWCHQMTNPMMNIGKTAEIYEDEHGLYVKAQLDLDTEMGAQVYRLIKEGRVNQMSFAFDVEDYAWAHDDEKGEFLELRRLKLHEVSVVQVGANQETELLSVKDSLLHAKRGRAICKADEDRLSEAARLIEEVLQGEAKAAPAEPEEDDSEGVEEDPLDSEGEKSLTLNPDAALAALYLTTEGA